MISFLPRPAPTARPIDYIYSCIVMDDGEKLGIIGSPVRVDRGTFWMAGGGTSNFDSSFLTLSF